MSDLERNVDEKYLRDTIEDVKEKFPDCYKRLEVTITYAELDTLLEAYERMIGDKCHACGSDTRKYYCHCENDE